MLNKAETDAMCGLRTSLVKEATDSDLCWASALLQCSFAKPAVCALCRAMGKANDWVADQAAIELRWVQVCSERA
jgi:hypothetical protein